MAHSLPELGYAHDALEPHIDAQTMEIHHGKHHNAYVTNLNAALEGNDELAGLSLVDLQAKIADTIFSAAQIRECGMVVMGAYGHSRLSEMLLGGVTRHSLTDPQMPIFLAH